MTAALTNEQLLWLSLGVWVFFILVLGYFAIWGKTTGSTVSLPSGNVASGAEAVQ